MGEQVIIKRVLGKQTGVYIHSYKQEENEYTNCKLDSTIDYVHTDINTPWILLNGLESFTDTGDVRSVRRNLNS